MTDWANGDRLVVSARETPPLVLSALTKRIEEQNPGLRVARLTLKDEPTASVAVRFDRDARTKVRPDSVYADPYDGRVLGPMRGEALFNTVLGLHRFLLIPGDSKGWGRQITGVCAIALLIFLASGLVLRWPQIHRLRIWLRPNLSRPGRMRWWSLHAVAGTWLLPVYLIIALSGLTWSYDGFKDIVNAALGAAKPAKPMRMVSAPTPPPRRSRISTRSGPPSVRAKGVERAGCRFFCPRPHVSLCASGGSHATTTAPPPAMRRNTRPPPAR